MSRTRPLVAILQGDPSGIGPELAVKLLARDDISQNVDIVLLADEHVLARGERDAGTRLYVPRVSSPAQTSGKAVLPVASMPEEAVRQGEVTIEGGRSCIDLLGRALDLAMGGEIDGFMFCPMNKAALHAAGLGHEDEMQWIRHRLDFSGDVGEINALEGLWTSRVTSHVPIRHVAERIDEAQILRATRLLDAELRKSGVTRPKLAMCGLNPHAGDGGNIGREEIDIIGPATERARAEGISVEGPLPADTIFVRARKGGIDGIVTMYHDQGQIAMKLMGFERGVTILGGLPMPITTPAHGTAYDIAGKGMADIRATLAAFHALEAMAQPADGGQ